MKSQSKKSKTSIRRFLLVSLMIVGIGMYSSLRVNAINVSYDSPSYSSLIPHDPIEITSDGNFTDYGFLGLGTIEDPYLIEEYNITTTDNIGIHIIDTTKFFVVRNCYVAATDYGIYINTVATGTAIVNNNTCNNNFQIGIYLYESGNSTVANNMCLNNGAGILMEYSDGSTVANNTCNNNNNGINLVQSGVSSITNNTCNNNKNLRGIYLSYSDSSTVADNTCSESPLGVMLYHSDGSTVAKF